GLGNAYILATGGTWRWQMLLHHEDQRHETFWRQLLQTLAAASPRNVTLTTDRSFYGDESRIALRAEVRDKTFRPARDAKVTVAVEGGAGVSADVELMPVPGEPGVYAAVYNAESPGIYRFTATASIGDETLGTARVAARRADGVIEHFRIEQNRALLERIAGVTGGSYFPLADVGRLPEAVRFSDAGLVERQVLDLWNMPAVFLLLLLLKGTEWLLRLYWGRL
ncbi:MAG: hypothetical protein C0P79_010825, partial [Gammaproteobacteria bacterium]